MKPIQIKKVITFLTLALFVSRSLGFGMVELSSVADPKEVSLPALTIQIPESIGSVDQRLSAGPSSSLLIHIQDAHGSYEAQKNIQAIVKHLCETYGIHLVLLEGAEGPLSPEMLDLFSGRPDLNRSVADLLMKNGELTGTEMFMLQERAEGRSSLEGYGMEGASLYRGDLEIFRKLIREKEKRMEQLSALEHSLEDIGNRTLNKDLRDYVRGWRRYESDRARLSEYLELLSKEAVDVLGLALTDPRQQILYPTLVRFSKLKALQKEWDPETLKNEKEELFRFLSGKVSPAALEAFKTFDQPSPKDLPRFLLEPLYAELEAKGLSFPPLKNFWKYFEYKIFESEMDGTSLFEEVDRLNQKILLKMCRTAQEKDFVFLWKDEMLLSKLLRAEISRGEYRTVLARRELIRPEKLSVRMTEGQTDEKLLARVKGLTASLEEGFREALGFYGLAAEREKAFLEKAIEKMGEKKADRAVLVSGGFHAEGIGAKAKRKGLSYLSIKPRLTDVGQSQEIYLRSILGESKIKESEIGNVLSLVPLEEQQRLGGLLSGRFTAVAEAIRIVADKERKQGKEPELSDRNPYLLGGPEMFLAAPMTAPEMLAAASLGGVGDDADREIPAEPEPPVNPNVTELLQKISKALEVREAAVIIRDPLLFRTETVDLLAREAAFSEDTDVKAVAQYLLRQAALQFRVKPASIHDFYMANKEGKWDRITLPGVNGRADVYNMMQQLFRAAKQEKVGAVIPELARSGMKNSYQDPSEFTAVVLAAAIKQGYEGLVFLQGDHYQVSKEKYFGSDEERQKEMRAMEDLIREAVRIGKYNIDLDPSTLVNESVLDQIVVFENDFVDRYLAQHGELLQDLDEDGVKSLRRRLVDEIEMGKVPFLTVEEQAAIEELYRRMHETSAEVTMHFIRYIRALEKEVGLLVPISIGIEERHIDNLKHKNNPSTVLGSVTLTQTILKQTQAEGLVGPSKLSLQTGTMHGVGGTVDFGIFERHWEFRDRIGVSVFVQHGASTLSKDNFEKMREGRVGEVHLSTEYQKIELSIVSRMIPELGERMGQFLEAYLEKDEAARKKLLPMWRLAFGDPTLAIEKAQGDTGKTALYQELASIQKEKSRSEVLTEIFGDSLPKGLKGTLKDIVKRLNGPFKKELWNLPDKVREAVAEALFQEFRTILPKLGASNTAKLVEQLLPYAEQPVLREERPKALIGASLGAVETEQVPGKIPEAVLAYAEKTGRPVTTVLAVARDYAGNILYLPDSRPAVLIWFYAEMGLDEKESSVDPRVQVFNASLKPFWDYAANVFSEMKNVRSLEGKVPMILDDAVFGKEKEDRKGTEIAGQIAGSLKPGDLVTVVWEGSVKPSFVAELYKAAKGAFEVRDLKRPLLNEAMIGRLTKRFDVPAIWVSTVEAQGVEIEFPQGDKVKLDLETLKRYGIDPAQVVALLRQIADYPELREKLFQMAGMKKTGNTWEVGQDFVQVLMDSIYAEKAAEKSLASAA